MKVKDINRLNSNIATKGLKVVDTVTNIPYTIENKTVGYYNGKLAMRYQLQEIGPIPHTIYINESELREYDIILENK